MSILIAALLGAVQGITEFLPISSSAHLLLDAPRSGGARSRSVSSSTSPPTSAPSSPPSSISGDDLLAMALAVPRLFTDAPEARLMRLVAIGTIPIVIVGLLFADWIEAHARLPVVTIVTLSVGAIGLLVVERLGLRTPRRRRPDAGRRDRLRPGPGGGPRYPGCRVRAAPSRSGCSSACGARPRPGSRSCSASRRGGGGGGEGPASRCRHVPMTSELATHLRRRHRVVGVVGYLAIRFLLRYPQRRTASTSSPTTAWPWPRCRVAGSSTDRGSCSDRRTAPIVR